MRAYPKPRILEELSGEGHAVIEASAGTGKTFTLEHVLVDLLLKHPQLELDQILVVTFTERATAELKVRVRRILARIVSATREDAAPIEGAEDGPHWMIGESERRKLERALFSFDVASIYTIHGFCQRVLTEYAFANQRAFDLQHIDFPVLFERAFTEAMRRSLSTRDGARDWLEAWLETSSVEELRLLLQRTSTARVELWPRLREERLMEGLKTHGATFWETYSELYPRSARKRERAFMRAQEDFKRTGSAARFLMHADKEIVDLKHSLRNVEITEPYHRTFMDLVGALLRFKPAVAQVFGPMMVQALEREKERANVFTYDDMLSMVWESLEGPRGEWLAQTLRRRYTFALIDEFQDTDTLQWSIFKRIFVEREPSKGLMVIGDPKQAIYSFRGADVFAYIGAKDELEAGAGLGAACDTVHLEENYRSSEKLIDAYNTILDQEAKQPFFTNEDIRYDHPVRCGQPELRMRDGDGQEVSPIVLGMMKRKEEDEGSVVRMEDIYTCYGRWVAHEIRKLLDDDTALYFGPDGEEERLTARDIFVLTRSHSDEARLEPFLRAAGVPYALIKQEGLFQSPEAASIHELFRAIERPHERGRRLKAWATPFFDVPLDELVRCRDVTESHPLFRPLLEWSQLARARRFEELFTDILQATGLVRREVFLGDDERTLTNTLQLFEVILEEAHLLRLDFPELVAHVKSLIDKKRAPMSEQGNVKRLEHERDAVQLMTMHKSKGLEAKVVFLYAFGGFAGEFWPFHYPSREGGLVRALHILKPEDKISPRLRGQVEKEGRQEDERLLYVALTRAMGRLYLPYVPYVGRKAICKSISTRSYNVLNERLASIVLGLREGDEELHRYFSLQDIPYFGLQGADPDELEPSPDVLRAWAPASSLLEPVDHQEEYRVLRPRTMRMESYSSLKRRAGGYTTAPSEDDVLQIEDEIGSMEAVVSPDELPGGVRTGQFLHAILEDLDYGSLTQHMDVDDWCSAPEVRAFFEHAMIEHGLELEYLELSQRVIHRALHATVEIPHGVIYGLGMCLPNVREMEFLYPIPEDGHDPLGLGTGLEVERGFIKGYIDYVFEWNGRVYFVDWKSDVLDRYDAASLRQHFSNNYDTQALLYGLALCKLYGILDEAAYEELFGGSIYVFLRGVTEDSAQGIHQHRPSWSELEVFAERLATPDMGVH